jgi:hypothetical protein
MKFGINFGSTAVSTEKMSGVSYLCNDTSTSETEISFDFFDMFELAVPYVTMDSRKDECDWCPPPPQLFRHKKITKTDEVFLQRQQASRHIKDYRAAMGREIVTEEPGKWMCGQDGQRECALKIAEFIHQTSIDE